MDTDGLKFPSIQFPGTMYAIAYNEEAFRVPGALASVSYYRTYSDGDTQHSPWVSVSTYPVLYDAMRSALKCLSMLCREMSVEKLGVLSHGALAHAFSYCGTHSVSFCWDCVDAARATDKRGQSYIHRGKIVRGEKYRNFRDADPLPRFAEDAPCRELFNYAHGLYCIKYPNILMQLCAMHELTSNERSTISLSTLMQEIAENNAMNVEHLFRIHEMSKKLGELYLAASRLHYHARADDPWARGD